MRKRAVDFIEYLTSIPYLQKKMTKRKEEKAVRVQIYIVDSQ